MYFKLKSFNTKEICLRLRGNATNETNVQTRVAEICKYLMALWAGSADALWPHIILLSFSVLAGISVGVGIILERPKYSAAIQRIAIWLVICGVVVESACTIALFVVDERISIALNDKIIFLESPRQFLPNSEFASVGKRYLVGKEFDLAAENEFEPMMLALSIRQQLLAIGMFERLSNAKDHWSPPNGGQPVGEIIRPGIAVRSCDNKTAEPNRSTPAKILAGLLSDSGLGSKDAPIFVEPADADDCAKAPDVLHVEVGEKIVMPWTPPPGTVVAHPKLQLETVK
jgi:hypothetical protein